MLEFILPDGGLLSLSDDSAFGLLFFWIVLILLALAPDAAADGGAQ